MVVEPEDTLQILAGVELDGSPTRGEIGQADRDGEDPEEGVFELGAAANLPSARISSEFVVRHMVRVDSQSGAIQLDVAPELLSEGMRLQLHAFTKQGAIDEFRAHAQRLAGIHAKAGVGAPAGAMLVSCLGRGQYLYGEPNVETAALAAAYASDVPVAGFFAGGEIGPVGYRSYTHSFTSSLALFRPRERAACE